MFADGGQIVELPRWLPQPLRDALSSARGTYTVVRDLVRGLVQPPQTLEPTDAAAVDVADHDHEPGAPEPAPPTAPAHDLRASFRDMEVVEVVQQTADAVTLVLDNRGPDPLRFRPGQYLILVLRIDGRQVRRAYSLCSDPCEADRVAVTVKRVAGGLVSNWINDHVRPGHRIRTLGPGGSFGLDVRPNGRRRIVLVGAGAGITPLLSVARAVTAVEPHSWVELICGNRRWEDVLFREELARLATEHRRFSVKHVLTQPEANWGGLRGRLSGERLAEVIPVNPRAHYLVCGPPGMMEEVAAYLRRAEIPDRRVQLERFVAQGEPQSVTGEVQQVRFARMDTTLLVRGGQTVLEAGLAAGLPLRSSCRMGACGACRVRTRAGEIEMEQPNCLTPKEHARGYRLICVGRPAGPVEID